MLLGLVNVPVIFKPEPGTPPVIDPVTTGAAQLYVVPDGNTPFVPLLGIEVNATPLQTVFVMDVMAGVGFTVILSKEIIYPLQVAP